MHHLTYYATVVVGWHAGSKRAVAVAVEPQIGVGKSKKAKLITNIKNQLKKWDQLDEMRILLSRLSLRGRD